MRKNIRKYEFLSEGYSCMGNIWGFGVCKNIHPKRIISLSSFGYFGKEPLKEVKLLVCSIDGCLTNGRIYVTEDHKEMVSYDYRDIVGIDLLKKRGIQVSAVLKSEPQVSCNLHIKRF